MGTMTISSSPLSAGTFGFELTILTVPAMGAGAEYRATRDLWLSPQSRLLADSPEGADFVYDGQGPPPDPARGPA